MPFMLGCLPRTFVDSRIPYWAAYRAVFGTRWTDPGHRNFAEKMPADIGMMGNDVQGDCVFAGYYHQIQGWTFNARGHMITEPDNLVLGSYHELTGPGDNGTDPNQFFPYVLKTGVQIEPAPAPRVRHKSLAVFEVDPRNQASMREAIDRCCGVQLAFSVPQYIMDDGSGAPRKTWNVPAPGDDETIVGGHMVWLPGFPDKAAYQVASWGSHDYVMTPAFASLYGQGAWACVDPSWITTVGTTPFGLTVRQLEEAMRAITHA